MTGAGIVGEHAGLSAQVAVKSPTSCSPLAPVRSLKLSTAIGMYPSIRDAVLLRWARGRASTSRGRTSSQRCPCRRPSPARRSKRCIRSVHWQPCVLRVCGSTRRAVMLLREVTGSLCLDCRADMAGVV